LFVTSLLSSPPSLNLQFVTLSGWYSGVRESSNEVSNAVANEGMRDGMVMRLLNEEDER